MQKKLLIFFIFILSFLSIVNPANAHTLKTDGSIGVLLHIDPNDDPVAGKPASIFFAIKDSQQKFQPENCACSLLITEHNKTIFSQPLFKNTIDPNLDNPSLVFVFPHKDVYQIIVSGKPLHANDFQPFSLTYDIRVDKEHTSSSPSYAFPSSKLFSYLLFLLIFCILVAVLLLYTAYRRKKRPRS